MGNPFLQHRGSYEKMQEEKEISEPLRSDLLDAFEHEAKHISEGRFLQAKGPESVQTLLNVVYLAKSKDKEDREEASLLLEKYWKAKSNRYSNMISGLSGGIVITSPDDGAVESIISLPEPVQKMMRIEEKKDEKEIDAFFGQEDVKLRDTSFFALRKEDDLWNNQWKYIRVHKKVKCPFHKKDRWIDLEYDNHYSRIIPCLRCSDQIAACEDCYEKDVRAHVCKEKGCKNGLCQACSKQEPFESCAKCTRIFCSKHLHKHNE